MTTKNKVLAAWVGGIIGSTIAGFIVNEKYFKKQDKEIEELKTKTRKETNEFLSNVESDLKKEILEDSKRFLEGDKEKLNKKKKLLESLSDSN